MADAEQLAAAPQLVAAFTVIATHYVPVPGKTGTG